MVCFLSVFKAAMAQYLVQDSFWTDKLRVDQAEIQYQEILARQAGGVCIHKFCSGYFFRPLRHNMTSEYHELSATV